MKEKLANFITFTLLVALTAYAIPTASFAYVLCTQDTNHPPDSNYCTKRYGTTFWITSTTLTGPIAVLLDGEMDLSNKEVRDLLLAQSETLLSGTPEAISDSENLVRILSQTYGTQERKMAEILIILVENKKEIRRETISALLN